LVVRLIETEDRPRLICDRGHILYVNPKVVVGVIPERDGRVLFSYGDRASGFRLLRDNLATKGIPRVLAAEIARRCMTLLASGPTPR